MLELKRPAIADYLLWNFWLAQRIPEGMYPFRQKTRGFSTKEDCYSWWFNNKYIVFALD